MDGRHNRFKRMYLCFGRLPLEGAHGDRPYISYAKLQPGARRVDRTSIDCTGFELYELCAAEAIPETYVETSKLRSALRTWCFYSSSPSRLKTQLQHGGIDASEIERLSRYVALHPATPKGALEPDDAPRIIRDWHLSAPTDAFLRSKGLIESLGVIEPLLIGVEGFGYDVRFHSSDVRSNTLSRPANRLLAPRHPQNYLWH